MHGRSHDVEEKPEIAAGRAGVVRLGSQPRRTMFS
jgi:hypothetical protein